MFHATVALTVLVCYWLLCIWLENDTDGIEWGNVWVRFAPFAALYACIQLYLLVSAVFQLGALCG